MNLRIQTYGNYQSRAYFFFTLIMVADNVSVYTVLEKGLEDLMAMCDVIEDKFTAARDEHVSRMET